MQRANPVVSLQCWKVSVAAPSFCDGIEDAIGIAALSLPQALPHRQFCAAHLFVPLILSDCLYWCKHGRRLPPNHRAVPSKAPGTVILRLNGPVTLATAVPLRAQFRDFALPSLTIIDLAGVPYVDSAGMSEIISHEIHCRENNARLILAGVSPRVLNLLRVTQLERVITVAATVAEAEAMP